MTLGEIILKYRTEHGLSQRQFAEQCKGVSNGYVSMVEQGRNPSTGKPVIPSIEKLKLFAEAMGMTLHDLLKEADDMPVDVSEDQALPPDVRLISDLHVQRVPMIGEVAAGEPIYAPEDWPVYVDAPVKCDAAITIKGESMTPNYLPGDVVYIRCTPDVPEGTVAVVFLDNEATIKHVYKRPTGLTLISDNPEYPPLMPEFMDYDNKIRIFGVPVGFTRMYKADPLSMIHKGFKK